MASSSSAITCIDSAWDDLELLKPKFPFEIEVLVRLLRKLRIFLLCARKLSNDFNLRLDLGSLRARIEDVVSRNLREIQPYRPFEGINVLITLVPLIDGFLHDMETFEKEISELYINLSDNHLLDPISNRSPQTADEIVEMIDSILEQPWLHVTFPYHREKDIKYSLAYEMPEKLTLLKNLIRFFKLLGPELQLEEQHFEDLLTPTEAVIFHIAYLLHFRLATQSRWIPPELIGEPDLTYVNNSADVRREKLESDWWKGMKLKVSELLKEIKSKASIQLQALRNKEDNITIIKCDFWKRLKLKVSVLLQRIKSKDSVQLQALKSSKLLTEANALPLNREDDITIIKDFIDSLVCILWQVLQLDTHFVVSVNDQLQALYAGLRFLRTSLKEQPKKFDEKTWDQTRVVTCDAAIIIFSLSQTQVVDTDLELPDLLQRIKIIRAQVAQDVLQTSTAFHFPMTNGLGYVDYLLENMMEMESCADKKNQKRIRTIREELALLRPYLAEISELRSQQEELLQLWNRVMELAYRVEILMDSLVVHDIPYSFSVTFNGAIRDMRGSKREVMKICRGKRLELKVKEETGTSNHIQSRWSVPTANEVASFDVQVTSIIDRLTRGSEQLQVVAVLGMPGIGKTTLATKVYNDPSVVCHFHVRAWTPISYVFDKKKVLLELLNQIVPNRDFEVTEQDLAEKLRQHLLKKRYLIFLDDVWGIETWNALVESLPNDLNGSRIILTSRLPDVAPQAMLDKEPHLLHPLSKEESWELLQLKLFPGNVCPASLCELGMEIAANCEGLPLTIVIVAGLLATMEREGWEEVLDSLRSGIIYGTDLCQSSMELSYKHLPDHLKPCLLYLGLFPEDQEIPVERLIWLWNAEGFVRKSKLRSPEDVGTDYVMDLISRSLVMVSKRRSLGGVKACHVHDLVYEFCKKKAEKENVVKTLQGYNQLFAFGEPYNLRRLCIQSELSHFMESKLHCPYVRSLTIFSPADLNYKRMFRISYGFSTFKRLNVLNLEQTYLGSEFPDELGRLVLLKYLAVKSAMRALPVEIGNLSNLETLVINSGEENVLLPHSVWNLQKLRHLYFSHFYGDKVGGFRLPKDLGNSSSLNELDGFCDAVIDWHLMEEQMKKFPCIRKLKCKIIGADDGCQKVIVPDLLSRLESLELSYFGEVRNKNGFEIGFPANLKRLVLCRFRMPWSKISTVGQLPNLEILKLLFDSFTGETWNMEEGEFPKLKFLKLAFLDIVRWRASDDQFPHLQKLVLHGCGNLEEIPWRLECAETLEMIEVSRCSGSLESSVKHIQEEQMSWGNMALNIRIHSSFEELLEC